MKIIDMHCDALLKLWRSAGSLTYATAPELETNRLRLKAGGVYVQFYAIFVPPEYKSEQKFQIALEQIDLFYSHILAPHKDIVQIKSWADLEHLTEDQLGAVLALEGADAIGNDLSKLNILYQLGVRSVGLTWNQANLCADGVGEVRGAGLTDLGRAVVQFNNTHLLFTDVSHLSERGFWDVLEIAQYPMASHSNARAVCNHLRNLTDEQASALFKKGGFISVVYYPPFIKEEVLGAATLVDLIRHIDHFCALGGVDSICLGSDFDGIDANVPDLEDASMYQNLINELLKYYTEDVVRGFAYQNFLNHRPSKARL